jgi:hypothetical protein
MRDRRSPAPKWRDNCPDAYLAINGQVVGLEQLPSHRLAASRDDSDPETRHRNRMAAQWRVPVGARVCDVVVRRGRSLID